MPEDIQEQVRTVQEQITSGELDVLAGEIKDNEGNVVVPAGSTMEDSVNRNMDFLVDNVIGSLQ